jgi:hypothetical protein
MQCDAYGTPSVTHPQSQYMILSYLILQTAADQRRQESEAAMAEREAAVQVAEAQVLDASLQVDSARWAI